MDRTERFHQILRLLQGGVVTFAQMQETLEVSPATIKRDLQYLRDRLHAPIVWDTQRRGYVLERTSRQARRFALPGLWFTASEVHALLTMEHLLSNLQPGFLQSHIAPFREKIQHLLGRGDHTPQEVIHRLRVLPMAARVFDACHFEVAATAVLERRRLRIKHLNRRSGEIIDREVSPQRLVYYRASWYLDAWCHMRRALRSFGLDAIQQAELLDSSAHEVSDQELDAELGSGYGIFAGSKTRTAKLRFSAKIARWVEKESWFPQQKGRTDRQGRYILEFPYAQDTELIMDILRYGEEVEVLKPSSLRAKVRERLQRAVQVYSN